jgi:SAM-dependent methyltransferase
VAGCGTGQHAIETAQRFASARVLAIDLSSSSLAYAQRTTREISLDNIIYAQADILALQSIDRQFDLIDASGVLHHLAEPFVGWQTLLSLLRPGAVMKVALYSKSARGHVKAARAFITERGYRPTADDMRRCRQDLMDLPHGSLAREVTRAEDFFAMSECRDLLFHVQEHGLTLPQISAFLASMLLSFWDSSFRPGYLHSIGRDSRAIRA